MGNPGEQCSGSWMPGHSGNEEIVEIPQYGSNVLYWEIYCVSLPFHNVDPMYCIGKYIVSPSHSTMWIQCIVLGNILCLPPIPQCGSNVLCWEIYCVSLPFHNVDPMYCVGKYIVSPSHSTMW